MTENNDRVPEYPPFGGPTDGDTICGRCGVNLTGCALCAGERRYLIIAKDKR